MRKIDRYLLRQFVGTFLICFVSLAGLYTVIDAFGRMDDFTTGRPLGEAAASAGRYYLLQSLGFFNKTSGVLTLIAAMFTVTWIQRHNEMTALLAAGVPRLTVLRPILLASACVALGAAGLREFVLPGLSDELSLDSKHLAGDATVSISPRYDNVTDVLLGGERASLAKRTIFQAAFALPPRVAGAFGKQLVAESAVYLRTEGNRPAGYLLTGVTAPKQIDTRQTVYLPGRPAASGAPAAPATPLVVTRRDAAWLEPGQAFLVSGVSFDLLAAGPQWRDLASTREMVAELANPATDLGPDVRTAVHSRVTQPALDLTLLLIGLPLVVARGARSPFVAIGMAVVVVTGFFVLVLGGQALGSGGWVKPAFAAWMPLFVFAPIAAFQANTLRQ